MGEYHGRIAAFMDDKRRESAHEKDRIGRLSLPPAFVRKEIQDLEMETGRTWADTGEYDIRDADGNYMEVDDFIRTYGDGIILNAMNGENVYTATAQRRLMGLWNEIKEAGEGFGYMLARRYVCTADGTTRHGPGRMLRESVADRRIFDAITEAWHHQSGVRRDEIARRRHVMADKNAPEYAERLAKIKQADALQELRDYILGIDDPVRRHTLMTENADVFGDMSDRIEADMEAEAGGADYVAPAPIAHN